MDDEFAFLFEAIRSGKDLIVPSPNASDLQTNAQKYFDMRTNEKLFEHNLGTGIANLDCKYLKYIQLKLDALSQSASRVESIGYCKDHNRLSLFDEVKEDKTQSLAAIHYESPHSMTRYDEQSNVVLTTPTSTRRRIPHYKSPNGYAQSIEEWKHLSSPNRNSLHRQTSNDDLTGIGLNDSFAKEMQFKQREAWLSILFYFPRQMYQALVIENRPQNVFKLLTTLFVFFAFISFALCSFDVSTTCLLWICLAILSAIGGADTLYGIK